MADTDEQFLADFQQLRLSPEQFTHHAHVRVAWLHLQRYELDEAIAHTGRGIEALATHFGTAGKFHWTITAALLHLMHSHGAADRALSWDDFRARVPDLLGNARALLARHYSDALLASDAARQSIVAPDLAPLPA